MKKEEPITDLAERLYKIYRQTHPWTRLEWSKLEPEFKEIWYQVAVEARK